MQRSGEFNMDFFDFSKIQFDTVDVMGQASGFYDKGLEVIWRVFPPGKYGDRQSEYTWGTVQTLLGSSDQGVRVATNIRVKL